MSVFDKHLKAITFTDEILALETTEDMLEFCREFVQLHDPIPLKTERNEDTWVDRQKYNTYTTTANCLPPVEVIAYTAARKHINSPSFVESKLKIEVANQIGLELLKSGHIKFTSDFSIMMCEMKVRGEVKVTK